MHLKSKHQRKGDEAMYILVQKAAEDMSVPSAQHPWQPDSNNEERPTLSTPQHALPGTALDSREDETGGNPENNHADENDPAKKRNELQLPAMDPPTKPSKKTKHSPRTQRYRIPAPMNHFISASSRNDDDRI
jgi:hypothetical protein